jgi:hypothetical protein
MGQDHQLKIDLPEPHPRYDAMFGACPEPYAVPCMGTPTPLPPHPDSSSMAPHPDSSRMPPQGHLTSPHLTSPTQLSVLGALPNHPHPSPSLDPYVVGRQRRLSLCAPRGSWLWVPPTLGVNVSMHTHSHVRVRAHGQPSERRRVANHPWARRGVTLNERPCAHRESLEPAQVKHSVNYGEMFGLESLTLMDRDVSFALHFSTVTIGYGENGNLVSSGVFSPLTIGDRVSDRGWGPGVRILGGLGKNCSSRMPPTWGWGAGVQIFLGVGSWKVNFVGELDGGRERAKGVSDGRIQSREGRCEGHRR